MVLACKIKLKMLNNTTANSTLEAHLLKCEDIVFWLGPVEVEVSVKFSTLPFSMITLISILQRTVE